MHDESSMRVRNRVDDLQEEPKSRSHVEPLTRAVGVDGAPLDVLEREIRTAADSEPRVVQAGDVGMRQRCQDVALPRHPLHEIRRGHAPRGSFSAT